MIYTVTFNPSLDYVIGAEKLEPEKSIGQREKTFTLEVRGIMFPWYFQIWDIRVKHSDLYQDLLERHWRRCWTILAVIPILSSWITDLPESM